VCRGIESALLGQYDRMTGRLWRDELVQPFEDRRDVAGGILGFHDATAIDLAAAMEDGLGLFAKDFGVVVWKIENAGATQPPAKIGRLIHGFVLTNGAPQPFEIPVRFRDDAGNCNSCANRRILSDGSEYV